MSHGNIVHMFGGAAIALVAATSCLAQDAAEEQVRARDIGITPGVLEPGPLNAITDVKGVLVGHVTIIATDAPLSDRNLTRLARRSFAGLARTGASMTNGSGDYAIAFSTHPNVRRTPDRRRREVRLIELANAELSPLSQAVIEATEEAIYNSLLMAQSATHRDAHGQDKTYSALSVKAIRKMIEARGRN